MKKIIALLVLLMAISSVAYAQEYVCSDADTSTFSTIIIVGSDSIPIRYNETCNFGCKSETGRCNPSPYDIGLVDVGIMFILLCIGLTFFYVSFRTDQAVYKLMYFLIALMFVFASMLTAIITMQQANKSAVLGSVEVMIWFFAIIIGITTLLLFLMILKDATDLLKKKKII